MVIKYINRKTGQEHIESPPGEGLLRFLYHSAFGRLALETVVKRKVMTSIYGNMMDRPKSIKSIRPFVERFNINLQEAKKSLEEFESFNDFFYRELKPEARPIEDGFVSPGDGRLIAFEKVEDIKKFYVKGRDFTLSEYLQNESLAQRFQNSTLIVLRLAPDDYHRFHFPYAGKATAPHRITGRYFSVSPYALANNFTRVFCENKREYTILETQDRGTVLLSPVGATMVGSIVSTYPFGSYVKKGQEMGYFKFGGSSVLILIDRDKIELDRDLLENTQKGLETYVKMGERIGQ